jgi:hypothetical protein
MTPWIFLLGLVLKCLFCVIHKVRWKVCLYWRCPSKENIKMNSFHSWSSFKKCSLVLVQNSPRTSRTLMHQYIHQLCRIYIPPVRLSNIQASMDTLGSNDYFTWRGHSLQVAKLQCASWKLSPLNIKIASSLEVPATCIFFLCVWAVLRLVLAVFFHFRMKTFCMAWI